MIKYFIWSYASPLNDIALHAEYHKDLLVKMLYI